MMPCAKNGGRSPAYCASKFGVNGLAEAMMQDVRYEGIRVSSIMPGSVATDFGGSAGSNLHEPWKLSGKDIAQAVIDIYPLSRPRPRQPH